MRRGVFSAVVTVALSGCWTVGPKYHRPTITTPAVYKELTPAEAKETEGWKIAQPKDDAIHGRWWEVFHDTVLNALEEKVDVSNQNIAASLAGFLAARAIVRQTQAQYFPTLNAAPSFSGQKTPSQPGFPATPFGSYSLLADASWAPDLFGRIRSTVNQNVALAQASAADLENERLLEQAELAVDYYDLRGQDALLKVLNDTVDALRSNLELTRSLFETGIESEQAVAQADTQLQTTIAQAIGVGVARAQFEHAIAVLLGQSPSTFSIPVEQWNPAPPPIPYGVPSQLLERRPDVASAERSMAAANAQIGIGLAAFYPSITLSGSVGIASNNITTLFSLPSLAWSVGASLLQFIFDGGLRQATVDQYKALYDQAVASYRQTVLTAFQQVEDNLAALRILSRQLQQQQVAIDASRKFVDLSVTAYKTGVDSYLNVLTAQVALLGNEQAAVAIETQQMTSSVQLIQALGGGWDESKLPSPKNLAVPPPVTAPPSR